MISSVRQLLEYLAWGGTSSLYDYEMTCLRAWLQTTTGEVSAILERQMKRFNLFQRTPNGKRVAFYERKDPLCRKWPPELFFPLRTKTTVATIWLSGIRGEGRNNRADIVLYDGRLSSIEFSNSPKPLVHGAHVKDVRQWVDPMVPVATSPSGVEESTLSGWLANFVKEHHCKKINAPLTSGERSQLLDTIDAQLPSDYLELVAMTDGFMVKSWQVYGLSRVRELVWPERSFFLLAESEYDVPVAIGVRQGDRSATLYFLDQETEEAKPIGSSFRAALESTLGESRS